MLLLYILWDDRPIFRISASNEPLQQQLEHTLLKPDCHSWWISKMQSGREDTFEERYAIKFCFKLGKNDATETYGMLQTAFGASCINRASVLSGIRDSRKVGSLWGVMRGMGGVRKSIHHSWLTKGSGLVCWGFVVWKSTSITWQTILLHASVHATRLLSTYALSHEGSFYNTWLSHLHGRAESLRYFTRDKQIQKRLCVAILAFFFLVKRLKRTNAATR